MRNRCRSRRRNAQKRVLDPYSRMVAHFAYVQGTGEWREWSFRLISQRQAKLLVDTGEAEAVVREKDGAVQVVGYRALQPTRWKRPTPCTLTFATMIAVGNADGDADPRYALTRHERRQIEKFKVWPLIGDTKAAAVRPRISERERREAEQLLDPGLRRRCRRWAAASAHVPLAEAA